jgi:hypothetical protein
MRKAALGVSLATVLLVAVLLAGCGGSDRLSDSQLRAEATAICTQATRQTDRIPTPHSPAGGMQFLNRGIAVFTPELTQLRLLKAPKDDVSDVYQTSLKAFSQKLRALKAAQHEIKTGASPVTAMTALAQRLAPIESSEDGAWRALQVFACLNR